MNVDDIDELDPGMLANYLVMAAADVEKRARELMHIHATHKRDAAQRLIEKVNEYVALCDRHALVRWGDWRRVEELRRVAKSLRELGEDVDADLYEARAPITLPPAQQRSNSENYRVTGWLSIRASDHVKDIST